MADRGKGSAILSVIMQPYIVDIIRLLRSGPQRYSDLKKMVPNDRTLSTKLTKLQDYKFIRLVHKRSGSGYVNIYTLSGRGVKLSKFLEKVN